MTILETVDYIADSETQKSFILLKKNAERINWS